MQIEMHCRLELRLENLQRVIAEPIAREAIRDERIIVRPNRTIVVSDWVVAGFACRDCANSPA